MNYSDTGRGHQSVLLREVLQAAPVNSSRILDCTLGGGGHAIELLMQFPQAQLVGLDRDDAALKRCQARLDPFKQRIRLIQAAFSDLDELAEEFQDSFDFMLADIGVSSFQLDIAERGFSFRLDGPLDMRMDLGSGRETAEYILNHWSEKQLSHIFAHYGEFSGSFRLAREIVRRRDQQPFNSTLQFAEFVERLFPRPPHKRHKMIHPATLVFQALRIAVNNELEELEGLLTLAPKLLKSQGRLAIISFHSLEDRLVKQQFRSWESPCTCPPQIPYCVCGKKPLGRRVKPHLIRPQEDETRDNPRSRSSRMRVFERLKDGDIEALT